MNRHIGRLLITLVALALLAAPIAHAQQPGGLGQPELPPLTDEQARDMALEEITKASLGDDPFLRSNAIEALSVMPQRALPLIQRGLADKAANVRFAAVVTAGQLKLDNLVPAIRPLLNDENESVQAAAIFALHTLGVEIDLTPLAALLENQDPGLRSNVALLLGMLGDESAIPMLKRAARLPMPRAGADRVAVTRIQIAEAVAKLGDDGSLDAIRAGAYSTIGEVRLLSVIAMGAVHDERMAPVLLRFLDADEVEVRVAAAGSLARLGKDNGLAVLKKESTHAQTAVRAQVAFSLGWVRGEAGRATLHKLLRDPEQQARVAAAAAELRRQSPGGRKAG